MCTSHGLIKQGLCRIRDLDDGQDDNEEEAELFDGISSCLSVVLRRYGDAAMELVNPLMPYFGALLDPARPVDERRIGICVLDDIIEHSPAGVQTPAVVSFVGVARQDDHSTWACACHGCNLLCEHVFSERASIERYASALCLGERVTQSSAGAIRACVNAANGGCLLRTISGPSVSYAQPLFTT